MAVVIVFPVAANGVNGSGRDGDGIEGGSLRGGIGRFGWKGRGVSYGRERFCVNAEKFDCGAGKDE